MSKIKFIAFALTCLLLPCWVCAQSVDADFKLDVPVLKQKYPFTCEAAALRMVLQYYGIKLEEDQILSRMPVDKTPRTERMWGDPDQGFVGDVYGANSKVSYGIHWKPLSQMARHWKKSEAFENAQVTDLTKHLKMKRPIIAWVNDGTGRKLEWQTPQGKTVKAIEGEHTVVMYGFRGPAQAPVGFFVIDPNHGSQFKTTKEFEEKWNPLGKSYVILYGKNDG